jgi:hypothetical protein
MISRGFSLRHEPGMSLKWRPTSSMIANTSSPCKKERPTTLSSRIYFGIQSKKNFPAKTKRRWKIFIIFHRLFLTSVYGSVLGPETSPR